MTSLPANFTSPQVTLPPLPSLTNTYGATLISTFLALALYGSTVYQTHRYYRLFPADITFHRLLVPAIFITDTFHSASVIHICYHYLVQNYLNPFALPIAVWSIKVAYSLHISVLLRQFDGAGSILKFMPLSMGFVVLLCQSFYTRRIFLVNRRFGWIVVIIVIMMLGELAFFIATTVRAFKLTVFDDFSPYLWLDSACFGAATFVDLILMIVFLVVLQSSKTAFRSTKKGLDRLAIYAVIATLLNTVLTLPAMIFTIISKETFIYLALSIPTAKIYTNGVLAFLNVRHDLAERTNALKTMTFGMSTLKRAFGIGETSSASSSEVPSSSVIDISALEDGTRADGPSTKTPHCMMI
ncbi:hypothetical protein L226DRAFT_575738 [Lentinus tigrinus ALCF2SS1-7]|uniref:uncharacterized protein n=1 Tax=Lentinus tigrinus ALCF2SS1-7 TaxID=1328758 RepID=UPI0011662808|nr:hypothetical protein L226DRAFT_575738 [Lentinus tigrinus ALCF2SS1-7]